MKPCRYLEETPGEPTRCAYYQETMHEDDAVRCYPGGWPCFEEDNRGCIYHDGQWMTLLDFAGAEDARADRVVRRYLGLEYPQGVFPQNIRVYLGDWVEGVSPDAIPKGSV